MRCSIRAAAPALALAFLPADALAAQPPAGFAQANHAERSGISLSLRAPAVVDRSPYQRLTDEQQRWDRRRLNRRADNGSADEIQGLGLLSNAYNFPLNMSSDPPQTVFVQLDTGSSDLWVASQTCQTTECSNKNVVRFDQSKSKTYRALTVNASMPISANATASTSQRLSGSTLGSVSSASAASAVKRASQPSAAPAAKKRKVSHMALVAADASPSDLADQQVPFSISYSEGTIASGFLAVENISLGLASVPDQIFGLVNDTNVTLPQQGISGVFGLGFPRGSVISRSLLQYPDHYDGQNAPLLSSLVESSNLSYPMFSLVLNETGGLFTWGAVAPEILPTDTERGLVEWHNVVPFPSGNSSAAANDTSNLDATALGSYVYWALRLTGAGVNGSASTLTPTYSQVGNRPLALIDSGTSAIFGPPSDVESLFSKIQDSRHVGNGQWVVPCDTKVKMYFSFGSARNLTLRPEEYIIGPAAAPSNLCYAWPAASQGGSDGIDWIFGLPFLRTVYSIFSYGIDTKEPPKIGFYPLQQQANTTNSTIIFAPEPAESLSSFLAQATTVNSVLPNSLVSVPTPSTTSPYVFANATYTPSIGLVPTAVGANSTYSAMISAQNGITALPALANNTTPLPVPTNPASEKAADGALSASIPSLMAISSLVALSTAWVSIWDSFSAFGPL